MTAREPMLNDWHIAYRLRTLNVDKDVVAPPSQKWITEFMKLTAQRLSAA